LTAVIHLNDFPVSLGVHIQMVTVADFQANIAIDIIIVVVAFIVVVVVGLHLKRNLCTSKQFLYALNGCNVYYNSLIIFFPT
jgi:hypothetical protein